MAKRNEDSCVGVPGQNEVNTFEGGRRATCPWMEGPEKNINRQNQTHFSLHPPSLQPLSPPLFPISLTSFSNAPPSPPP